MSTPAVFISSTARDLAAYRAAARNAVERAGFRMIGMESFDQPPAPDGSRERD
jgi:hypothetical protein